jgi:hypothetical protein
MTLIAWFTSCSLLLGIALILITIGVALLGVELFMVRR